MTSSKHFDNICSLPLPSDLFTQILHPTQPIVTIGLASGHVHSYRLPPTDSPSSSPPPSSLTSPNGNPSILSQRRRSSTASENGLGSIETLWKTRRHKGSCRALAYSHDGALCYSAGTDGLVKVFESETGRVISKAVVSSAVGGGEEYDEARDAPSVVHALSPQGLLVGTDGGALGLYDLREGGRGVARSPAMAWKPHGNEPVNQLTPLPASETSTSGFAKSWVSVGASTLAVTDVRKGVLRVSEDLEAGLGSLCLVQGLKKGGTSVGEKVLVGQDDGVIGLFERGVWDDIDERIVVDRQRGAVECLVELPLEMCRGKVRMGEKIVAAGLEDGRVRFVRIGRNGVVDEWDVKHDEVDGVVAVGFDEIGGRMVTGGGMVLKVWTEQKGAPGGGWGNVNGKRQVDDSEESGDDDEDEQSEDDSEEEEKPQGRKKRKRNKGKDKSGGQALHFSGSF